MKSPAVVYFLKRCLGSIVWQQERSRPVNMRVGVLEELVMQYEWLMNYDSRSSVC